MNYIEEMCSENYLAHHGILGQKWGVRRYQNKDGTLTEAGKRRYDRDVAENNAKKKENRIVINKNGDPSRWVSEDLKRASTVNSNLKKGLSTTSDVADKILGPDKIIRADTSGKTDEQLRAEINRRKLENEYHNLFDQHEVSKGKENVKKALEIGGTVLAVTGTSLEIAMALKTLMG